MLLMLILSIEKQLESCEVFKNLNDCPSKSCKFNRKTNLFMYQIKFKIDYVIMFLNSIHD